MSSLDPELASLRIPLKDIVIATKDFAEGNLIKRGGKANVYKGFLLRSGVGINVVIHKYSSTLILYKFYEEIKRIPRVKHTNVVSFVGFCDEEDERMVVMEHVVNGNLSDYLSNPTALTWLQRLNICYGATLALERWKYNDGRSYNTKTGGFKILLDENWEAKVLMSIQSWPYDTKSVLYSLGVILLEVLSGRKTTIKDANQYVAKMGKSKYEEGRVDDFIDPNLRKQMLPETLSLFAGTTYDCLTDFKYRIEPRLKEAFEIQWKHEHHLQVKKFAYLKIPLTQIKLATSNFDSKYGIKSKRGYYVFKAEPKKTVIIKPIPIYTKITQDIFAYLKILHKQINLATDTYSDKAELNHIYMERGLTIEKENKDELPKKPVIIVRRLDGKTVSEDFFAEIEMLSSCKHPNLLTLLGYCDDDSEMILVFECDFQETLSDYLGSKSNMTNHTWEQRMRICLDVAHALRYIHNIMESTPSMIPEEIQSTNVFLDEKGTAKIIFRHYKFSSDAVSLESSKRLVDDIYSLGVIFVEILTGSLGYEPSKARQHLSEGKLKDIVDPRIMEETQTCNYTLRKGPNQYSLDTFSVITYQCLAETPIERPPLEAVIKSLEKALNFQVQNLEHLTVPLEDILSATKNFDNSCLIGFGGYGVVYKAKLKMRTKDEQAETLNTVAIKRIMSREDGQGKAGFFAEIDVLSKCEHPNIVSLLGFCVEGNEMIIVYEHASNGSLDDYLGSTDNKVNLTWEQRLKMCINIARGLNYLHATTDDKERILHRDIKSANILLDTNWVAKIADFGLSKVHLANQGASTINTETRAGTKCYLDPEYDRTGRLKKASDIYSFGVVLFEIFSGKLAYDSNYIWEDGNGLAPIARKHFEKGTLKEILDPKLRDEAHKLFSTLKVGPYHKSLEAFSKIAYQCLDKTQDERPTIEEVIKELKEALKFQENRKDVFKFSLEDIKLGVGSFSDRNLITRGYGMLYRGEVKYINGHKKVVVKRFHRSGPEHGFLKEFEVLFKYKHETIIGPVGYCKEQDEKIIVYEHASNGCLSRYLNDTSISWNTRLKICIDIAKGLNFLHGGDAGQDLVIHRDIKSSNILLTDDWKAKICGFELALTYPANKEIRYVKNDVVGSPGYCDQLFLKTGYLTKESDIYSFGVILFEILCGRLAHLEDSADHRQFLDVFVKRHFQAARVYDLVFDGIKEEIVRESLVTYQNIAFQCLHVEKEKRPTANEVVIQLQKALEFQEAYEIWEAKLPRNYKEILQLAESPEINSMVAKKDIHNILCKGILFKDDKVWFSIGDNGERNEMITARMFSFKNRWSHRWRSIQESRFRKVAQMSNVSNLNIQIKIGPQLLPSDVNYSVHLVFKFCCPRKSDEKRMYVNLKYKIGNENLHAYFATWREDKWMMIELCRFSNQNASFEVLLESFSRCYCDSRAIYIEGIEFRAIDNVKPEKTEMLEENQHVLISLSEMKREVYHVVSAESVVYDLSNVTLLSSKSSAQSRGEWIYKVPRRSVFCIKWYIDKCEMLPPNSECACYLVFKLSENCLGLHCPVIVRDQFHWKSKDIVYFRAPSPCNIHDTDHVPKKRRDGWMEVIVSKFNSDFKVKKGCLLGNLKFVCYEGTMSGLIIRGLELRPRLEE